MRWLLIQTFEAATPAQAAAYSRRAREANPDAETRTIEEAHFLAVTAVEDREVQLVRGREWYRTMRWRGHSNGAGPSG